MTLETGCWANISTFPSFFCVSPFSWVFFFLFLSLFLSVFCCSSLLWKGNGAVGRSSMIGREERLLELVACCYSQLVQRRGDRGTNLEDESRCCEELLDVARGWTETYLQLAMNL